MKLKFSGTISGTTVSSLTRGIGDSDPIAHVDGTSIELYQINGVPLTEINKTHTAIEILISTHIQFHLSQHHLFLEHLVMQKLVVLMFLQVKIIDLKLCKLSVQLEVNW